MEYALAQVNVARLLAPIDSSLLKPFVDALDDVAASHGVIVNLTTWTSTQALSDFIFGGRHLRQHGPTTHAFTICRHLPSPAESSSATISDDYRLCPA